jgi:hypothetical protein
MLERRGGYVLTPSDDTVLEVGDELLMAGNATARSALETTMALDSAAEYVLCGDTLPSGWLWRRVTRSGDRAAS